MPGIFYNIYQDGIIQLTLAPLGGAQRAPPVVFRK